MLLCVGVWGELVTHRPSSQGWAPECPLHHVGVFLHCRCGLVGSEFPSFPCDSLSSVHVVCYIHVHVFSCICVVGMSSVYGYEYRVHVRVHVHVHVRLYMYMYV